MSFLLAPEKYPRSSVLYFQASSDTSIISDNGQEYTKGLITEHSFISSYSAMISKSPSHFDIEALEEAKILKLPYRRWQQLLETDIFWVRFLLKFVEKGFVVKE